MRSDVKTCPGCGQDLEGEWPFIPHLKTCAALRSVIDREWAEEVRRKTNGDRRDRAGLPSDVTWAEYARRHDLGGPYASGAAAAGRFADDAFATFFAERPALPVWGFTLHGPPGAGKSTAAAAVGASALASGYEVRWVHVPLFVRHLGSLYRDGDPDGAVAELRDVPLLLLDDLGLEAKTPTWVNHLYGVILDRYSLSEGGTPRPVIVTTQFGMKELLGEYHAVADEQGRKAHSARAMLDRLRCLAPWVPFGETTQRRPLVGR